jgi:hypothetical protein
MSDFIAAAVVRRVKEAMQKGHAISFCHESPDHAYPEIKWQIFGLIDTNEVAVTARCGDIRVGIAQESWLSYPLMADRIFGIDVADDQLARKLAAELWKAHSVQLVEAAERVRSTKRQ